MQILSNPMVMPPDSKSQQKQDLTAKTAILND